MLRPEAYKTRQDGVSTPKSRHGLTVVKRYCEYCSVKTLQQRGNIEKEVDQISLIGINAQMEIYQGLG